MKMKKFLRPTILVVAAVMAAWLPMAGNPIANAISSCPTDPLSSLTPNNTNYSDSSAINAGVKFEVKGAPFVRGVKFYKGVDNTGTHVAHLYNITTSTELASETFSGETSSGWQTVSFSSDVQVRDDHSYMVWVSMPNGHYAVDGGIAGGPNSFASQTFGDSESVVSIPSGNSGVYSYTSDHTVVPSNSLTSNYWVSPVVGDTTSPQANSSFSSSHSGGRTISWETIGKDTNSETSTGETARTRLLRQQGEVFETLGYQAGDQSSITDPTAFPGASYSYRVANVDACNNSSSLSTVPSTAGSSQSFDTLFGSSAPSATDTGQTTPITVGMRWNSANAGNVAGVRIYRANGVHPTDNKQISVGLWDTSGNLLASRSLLAGNQQSGWINVFFNSPVSISANTDYIAGYFTPNGQEEYTNGTFNSAVTNGDLTAPAATMGDPNGVYSSASTMTFPSTASANNAWYGIDVNFYIP